MKLSAPNDLAPHRAAALARIDRHFAATVPVDLMLAPLRNAKAEAARAHLAGQSPHKSLMAEAAQRGLDVSALAELILRKQQDAGAALLAREAERQAAKATINQATDQHAILAALATIMGGI